MTNWRDAKQASPVFHGCRPRPSLNPGTGLLGQDGDMKPRASEIVLAAQQLAERVLPPMTSHVEDLTDDALLHAVDVLSTTYVDAVPHRGARGSRQQ